MKEGVTDGQTDRPTDGRTNPLIEMLGAFKKRKEGVKGREGEKGEADKNG